MILVGVPQGSVVGLILSKIKTIFTYDKRNYQTDDGNKNVIPSKQCISEAPSI